MTEFSKDELITPTWLDQSFFERALRSHEHDPTVEITNFAVSPGTKPGEHFASIMFRVDVTYSSKKYRIDNKNIKLILKTLPEEEGFKKEFVENTPAFKNETKIYEKVLPEMERVLETIGEKVKFGPKLIYQSLTKEKMPVIVLEDVSGEGFDTFDGKGIKSPEMLETMIRKLAKFHAASLIVAHNGQDLAGDFNESFFSKELSNTESPMRKMIISGVNRFGEETKKWGPEYEAVSEKLQGHGERLIERVLKYYGRSGAYNVLCHGDFHAKNLLFRNGCTKEEDLLFIDYQFSIWNSPTLDLCYFMNIQAHPEAIEGNRNDYILAYYLEFSSILRRANYRGNIPTLLDLHIEIIQAGVFDLFQTVAFISPRYLDWAEMDLELFMKDPDKSQSDMADKCWQREDFQAEMKKSLLRQLYTGALN